MPLVIVPTVVMLLVPAQVESAVFSTLIKLRSDLVVAADKASGAPVPAVLRPRMLAVAMSAILTSVMDPSATVGAIHTPSSRRNLLPSGVPVMLNFESAMLPASIVFVTAPLSIAQAVPEEETVMSPLSLSVRPTTGVHTPSPRR